MSEKISETEQVNLEPGVHSVGNIYHEGNVVYISNYWGLQEFLKIPLPSRTLRVVHIITGSIPYPEHNRPARFLDAERAWLEEREHEGRFSSFEYNVSDKTAGEVEEALS